MYYAWSLTAVDVQAPEAVDWQIIAGRVITQPVKGLLMQKIYKSLTFYLPNAELMPLLFYYLINFCVPGIW